MAERIIFILCGDTFATKHTTGVQRVVHSLVRHIIDAAPEYDFAVSPVVLVDETLTVIAPQGLTMPDPRLAPEHRPIRMVGGAWMQRVFDQKRMDRIIRWHRLRLQEMISRQIFRVTKSPKLRRLPFLAFADYPGMHQLRKFFQLFKGKTPLEFPFVRFIGGREDMTGHILLLPEVWWNRREWHPVREFQARGGQVVTIIHDLIPILQPDSSLNSANRAHYESWIETQVARSDAIIAVSKTIAMELRDYLAQHVQERLANVPIGHFRLGSDFDLSQQAATDLPPDVAAIFDPAHHVFLMVGTIAPRKNHRFVLDAFDRYWNNGGTAHLVFVGYSAYGTDDFLHYVGEHQHYGTRLHHLTKINDAELETIYRLSAALIMASSAEGFGLPLVEAQQRGLPVLCSDIPIFHEVTAERAEFFSLDTPDTLAALITDFETRHPPGQPIPRDPKPCLSWRESTQMMLNTMFELLERN